MLEALQRTIMWIIGYSDILKHFTEGAVELGLLDSVAVVTVEVQKILLPHQGHRLCAFQNQGQSKKDYLKLRCVKDHADQKTLINWTAPGNTNDRQVDLQ